MPPREELEEVMDSGVAVEAGVAVAAERGMPLVGSVWVVAMVALAVA